MAKIFAFFSFFLFFTLTRPLYTLQNQILVSAQSGVVGTELWCVAKNNAEDAALQTALDWACGPGAADCSSIQQGGACSDPTDIQVTASFAFNNYFLKNSLANDSCYFDNTAALTSLNPSHDNCKFPSRLTASNGSFSGSTTGAGFGPSQDINGGSRVAHGWFWPVITGHLFIIITRIISGR